MTDTPENDQDREGFAPVTLTPRFLLKCVAQAAGHFVLRVVVITIGIAIGETIWHFATH